MQCKQCGSEFTSTRADAAYCSSACRQSAYRSRTTTTRNVTDGPSMANAIAKAGEEALAIIPKKYHGALMALQDAINRYGNEWLESQVSAATEAQRAALDDEWARLDKLREQLTALELDLKAKVMKYDGREVAPAVVMRLMREDDVKIIRGLLHPDRQPDDDRRAKANKVFPKWRAVEESLTAWVKQTTIPTLEKAGWTKTVAERRAKRAKA